MVGGSSMSKEEITVRNPNLEWQDDTRRYWFGDSAVRSNWMNALSTTFPEGERFFIEAVKYYLDRIADPAMRRRIGAFIGQEAAHGREHKRFNDLLKLRGYPVDRIEARIRAMLDSVRRRNDPLSMLAIACALEHFTTILCTLVLREPRFHEPMSGEHFRLWTWHCLEELEHKSVAFDVYAAAGGTYWTRVYGIIEASLALWPLLISTVVAYQAHDRRLWSIREWWTALTWGFVSPGLLRRVIPGYLRYFRRDYHPSQNPDVELLTLWRERLK